MRRGKGLRWAQAVKVAMPFRWEFRPCLSQLPNKPRSLDLSATLPFWKPNFAEWRSDPRMGAVGRRLTALVLGFGRFATQTSHHDMIDRFVGTEHPSNRCALSSLVVLAYLIGRARLPR